MTNIILREDMFRGVMTNIILREDMFRGVMR
jgi:hypothetical protein